MSPEKLAFRNGFRYKFGPVSTFALISIILVGARSDSSAWFSLAGVIVGGLITYGTQSWLELLKVGIRSRQLAGALAGELQGFRKVMELWQVESELRSDLASMDTHLKAGYLNSIALRGFEGDESLLQVFGNTADQIGSLPASLAEEVATLYTLLRELIRRLKSIPEPIHGEPQFSPGYTYGFIKSVLSLIEDCRKRSERLIPQLQQYAASGLLGRLMNR